MSNPLHLLRLVVGSVMLLPHIAVLRTMLKDTHIVADIDRWSAIYLKDEAGSSTTRRFVKLMIEFPEFRNLFYHRAKRKGALFSFLCPPMSTLYIHTNEIGPGLFIQHGFATIISARSIGKNCWINQQVTIGFSDASGQPCIGDNVTINAGAKVIGNVTIGAGSKVGANSVVVKNVPAGVTVVGVPAHIVKRNGVRVSEPL